MVLAYPALAELAALHHNVANRARLAHQVTNACHHVDAVAETLHNPG